MRIACLKGEKIDPYLDKLTRFEEQFSYPAEGGSFRICHGGSYDLFFKTLRFNIDEPYFFIELDDQDQIQGIVVAVLQEIQSSKAWYLCDFKISPLARSLRILMGLLNALKNVCYPICQNAYAFSMNDSAQKNKILHFAMNNNLVPFSNGGCLEIFKMTDEKMLKRLVNKHPLAVVQQSTDSKTIVHNGQRIDLWHVVLPDNFVQKAKTFPTLTIEEYASRFFNAPNNLLLSMIKIDSDQHLFGTCSILQKGLNDINWSFIASIDI